MVIATRNRARELARTLRHLSELPERGRRSFNELAAALSELDLVDAVLASGAIGE